MNKRFKTKDVEVLFHSGDFMTLTTNLSSPKFTHRQHNIHIHNFYNEQDASNRPLLDNFTSILSETAIAANNLPYKMTTDHVIVGDLNIHHPFWGCKTTQADNRAPSTSSIFLRVAKQHKPTTGHLSYLRSLMNLTSPNTCHLELQNTSALLGQNL